MLQSEHMLENFSTPAANRAAPFAHRAARFGMNFGMRSRNVVALEANVGVGVSAQWRMSVACQPLHPPSARPNSIAGITSKHTFQ